MREETLGQLIKQGEGQTVEFKREFTTDVGKEIVAFANTDGGVIIIGVDDDGRIVGVEGKPRKIEERVMGVCRTNCQPPLTPQVEIAVLDGQPLVVISVAEGERLYSANNICYVRAGSTSRRAMVDELHRLALKTTPEVFERTPVRGKTWADLDLPRLQEYLEQRSPGATTVNNLSPQQLAVGLGLATIRGESAIPTAAGLMLFGLHPQWAMPEWGLSALRISGLDITDPIADRVECEGTADQLIEQGEAFVRRNLRVAAVFEDTGQYIQRQDVPEYPLFAAREAIANAVAHRDYGFPERITLRMFDDRLQVGNPGGLVGGLRLEELLQRGGRSVPRNRIMADFLRERGKMETVGRGLLRIQREMRELGSEPPVFRDEGTHFVVVLPSRHRSIPELQRK